MPVHATKPWDAHDSTCPFLPAIEQQGRLKRENNPDFASHNICRHPDCNAWIKDSAKTCKEHKAWYDRHFRWPAQRLVRLLRQAQQRGDLGNCPAIVRGRRWGKIAPDLERVLR